MTVRAPSPPAIDYVTTEELPKIYILEGHGEAELPASFRDQIEKENMETESPLLLTLDAIPERGLFNDLTLRPANIPRRSGDSAGGLCLGAASCL